MGAWVHVHYRLSRFAYSEFRIIFFRRGFSKNNGHIDFQGVISLILLLSKSTRVFVPSFHRSFVTSLLQLVGVSFWHLITPLECPLRTHVSNRTLDSGVNCAIGVLFEMMLCTLRCRNRRYVNPLIVFCSKEISSKVSNAIKPRHNGPHVAKVPNVVKIKNVGSNKIEPCLKTAVVSLPQEKSRPPLCTSVSKEVLVEDWTKISTDWKNVPHLYMKLSKIRLTTLVVISTMAGYAAATAPFEIGSFLCCCVGTGLLSSAANAINQYHEVPFDAQMSRTKNRVLVKAQLTPLHALAFASASSLSGLSILFYGCNGLTALLGAVNLVLYTSIYTPLKRISILNTWIGSIVGAIPPMMGWTSCTGHLEPGAWLLAGILYAWQFPHFNALSWNMRADYSRAGYRMMSVTHPDLCRRTTLRYTVAITVLCMLAPACDMTNNVFLVQMLPLNLYFTYLAYKFYRSSDSANSRQLFKFSLLHLPLLIALILINKKEWFTQNNAPSISPSKDSQKVIPIVADKPSISNLETNAVKTAKL